MAKNEITKADVAKAAAELAAMRKSLASWLKYRTINDQVLAGTKANLKYPAAYGQRVIAQARDFAVEQDLATKLSVLLGEVLPEAALPNPDLRQNPRAAVELATIALVGASPKAAVPSATGGVMATHPWLWPVLIVGGLLMAITTAIKTAADVANEKERLACIQAGACTDFGFFLKAGGIAALGYVIWQAGAGDVLKSFLRKKARS